MKETILISLLIITTALIGCASPQPVEDTAPPAPTYEKEYNDLLSEHGKLQAKYDELLASFERNHATITAVVNDWNEAKQIYDRTKERNVQINDELNNYINWLNDCQENADGLYDTAVIIQDELDLITDKYNKLMSQIGLVTSRQDITTTSNLTAEERASFYEMWDLWIKTLEY